MIKEVFKQCCYMENINRTGDNQSITSFYLVNDWINLFVMRSFVFSKLETVIASLAEAIVKIS